MCGAMRELARAEQRVVYSYMLINSEQAAANAEPARASYFQDMGTYRKGDAGNALS